MSVISRQSPIYEQVYDILLERLLNGEGRPGDRFRDAAWAKSLGVSRTPVQQAARKLEHDGILVALPAGGHILRQLDAVHLRHVYACRAALESLAVEGAARAIADGQIAALTTHVKASETALDRQAYHDVAQSNSAFHKIIIEASGNSVLVRLVGSVQRLIHFYRAYLRSASLTDHASRRSYAEHLRAIVVSHHQLIQAFRDRDAQRAAMLMREHIESTGRDMETILALIQHHGQPQK